MNKFLATYTYIIKKSEFIGYAYQITHHQEVEKILQQLKKEYKKSTHIVYGYKLIENNQIKIKTSDDGEPKGSASKPILNAIESLNKINIVVFIIRYFGESKLGVGGLYRSYSKCAFETLKLIK